MSKCNFCKIKDLKKLEGSITIIPGKWSVHLSRPENYIVYQHPVDIDMHTNSSDKKLHDKYLAMTIRKVPIKCDCKASSEKLKTKSKSTESTS